MCFQCLLILVFNYVKIIFKNISIYILCYIGDNDKLKITASHAIFVEDEHNEAPGSVVGYEMSHKKFYDRFMEITQTNENVNNSFLFYLF